MSAAEYERLAIYWTPAPESALGRFGAAWFGEGGAPERFGLPPELWECAVRSPARYRLHATLKAPFRPADNATPASLGRALDEFCAVRRAPIAGPLRFLRFDSFLGLAPEPPRAEVEWLAAECVTAFDHFRAPPDEADRARRSELGPREAGLFEAFGYPWVLSDFAFHITLAGPLEPAELDRIERALAPHLEGIIGAPLVIDALTLLGDPGGGRRLDILSRHSFLPRGQAANT